MELYTDLICDTCQQFSCEIALATNPSDEEKASKIQKYIDHLALANAEHKVYNTQCKVCHDQLLVEQCSSSIILLL